LSKFIESARENVYSNIEKIEEKEYYEASSAQKRLYTLHKFEDGNTAYNMPRILELEGKIDKERLENVFNRLIARHEVLRTSFEIIDDQIVQRIHDKVELNIEYIDNIDYKNSVCTKEENIKILVEEFVKPFDLSKAPLLRVCLVRLEETKYIMMFDIHHIISDGTTMGIATKELAELYAGKELEPLRIQYKDYAEWQQELLRSERIKNQKDYWIDRFSNDIPVLNMPYDYERPAIQSFEGDSLSFIVDMETTKKLRMLAKETGSTIYMVLLSAYTIFLSKYSGQNDIIIGSPISGRPHVDLENIMGMFVNTLVMRNYPEGSKLYVDFLVEVKENCLKAYENQDYQFEELVDDLKLRRDISRNALFDAMFVLLNIDMQEISIEDFTLKAYIAESKTAKFDLNLTAIEKEENIYFTLEYSTNLFEKEAIKKMICHFKRILEVISDNKIIQLSEIDMLAKDEKVKLLKEFNDTEADYPINKTIQELFEEQVQKTPNNIAITFKEEYLTYKELNEKANKLARILRNSGVNKESIIGIMLDRSLEMIIGVMAVIKAGGACLPINTEYPQKRIDYMLGDSRTNVILTESKYIINPNKDAVVDEIAIGIKDEDRIIINIKDESIYEGISNGNLDVINTSEDMLYVIYTSGTTGNPKGVMVGQRVLNNLIYHDYLKTNIDFSKKLLQFSNISFDAFFHEVLVSLLKGGELCIAGEEERKDIVKLFNFIDKNQIATVNLPAALAKFIFSDKDYADKFPKSIDHLITTGEQLIISDLLKEYIKENKLYLHNHYGPSETHVATTYTIDILKDIKSIPSIGKPIINTKAYILNEKYNLQPIGVVGELYLSGDCLGIGYLNRPELTTEKFIQNPYEQGKKMYKTGDLAKWMPDGAIEFLGRIDNQVKIRGFRVELGEIEVELMKYEDIKDAVVIDRKGSNGSNYLCAYLISDKELKINNIKNYLSKEMPEYMVPSYFMQIEEMPLTTNEKVDKRALPEPEGSINTGVDYEVPRNKVEEKLVEIWSEVLGIKKIGINDSFFELGGHSLKAMTLISKIHKETNKEVPLKELFKSPT
ncbi:non-ribosomal peptide synthetase, partial [Clostridium frigidicarnis]